MNIENVKIGVTLNTSIYTMYIMLINKSRTI